MTSTSSSETLAKSKLKNKEMEEIVGKWYSQMHDQVKKFTQQATELADWEWQLLTNSNKLFALYENADKAEQLQTELDVELDRVEAQQNEVNATLTDLEKKITEYFSAPE